MFQLIFRSKYLFELADLKETLSLSTLKSYEMPLCGSLPVKHADGDSWGATWKHRMECHAQSLAEHNKLQIQAGLSPSISKKCRTFRSMNHCECFTRKFTLHHRLRNWVPQGLNFCSQCSMFTRRKKQHGGRCEQLRIIERITTNHL